MLNFFHQNVGTVSLPPSSYHPLVLGVVFLIHLFVCHSLATVFVLHAKQACPSVLQMAACPQTAATPYWLRPCLATPAGWYVWAGFLQRGGMYGTIMSNVFGNFLVFRSFGIDQKCLEKCVEILWCCPDSYCIYMTGCFYVVVDPTVISHTVISVVVKNNLQL